MRGWAKCVLLGWEPYEAVLLCAALRSADVLCEPLLGQCDEEYRVEAGQ